MWMTSLFRLALRQRDCAGRMATHLDLLKSALRRDNMVLSDGEQQVLGLTKEVRQDSEAAVVNATAVAKDLGVSHFGYGSQHSELAKVAKNH